MTEVSAVFTRILARMRSKVRDQDYGMTLHAEDEMSEDDFTIWDIENAILNGEIVERQRDHETAEWKYCIQGSSLSGDALEVVTKLSSAGRLVIITVYAI